MLKKLSAHLLLLLTCFQLLSQKTGELVQAIELSDDQSIEASSKVTALAIRSNIYLGNAIEIQINEDFLEVPLDHDGVDYSYFISLPSPLLSPRIEIGHEVKLFLINSQEAPRVTSSEYRQTEDCEFEINPILQSTWRSGLNPPNYSRSFTEVNHVIVHHAAGSNTNTNYTQVVRDIYLYHTGVNGWSDIGYNYLVAQNGDLYAGRDPASVGDQDNVIGAHFCGRNATTMGICLLGNYETASPSEEMWTTLEQVVSFKINKEGLIPTETGIHPLGEIGHIAAHRDGCSTLCPGANVYSKLSSLRSAVDDNLNHCESQLSFSFSNPIIEEGESVVYTNTSTGYQNYTWHFQGGDPSTANWQTGGTVTYENPGLYDIWLVGSREGTVDSVGFQEKILVKGALKLFPNPINANETITLAEDTPIVQVELLDTKGTLCYTKDLDGANKFEMPDLSPGLYIMRILANGIWTSERVIVE